MGSETADRPAQATATADVAALDSSAYSANLPGKETAGKESGKGVTDKADVASSVYLSRAPPDSAGFVQFPTKQAAVEFLGLSSFDELEALVDSNEVHEGWSAHDGTAPTTRQLPSRQTKAAAPAQPSASKRALLELRAEDPALFPSQDSKRRRGDGDGVVATGDGDSRQATATDIEGAPAAATSEVRPPRQPKARATAMEMLTVDSSEVNLDLDLDAVSGRFPRRRASPKKLTEDMLTAEELSPKPREKKGKPVKVAPSQNPAEYCGFCCKLDTSANLLTCSRCLNSGHGRCLQLDRKLFGNCKKQEKWECIECKICAICQIQGNDDLLLFCDECDEGVHMYCQLPVVTAVPEGNFLCPRCETGEMPRRELTKHAVKTQCSRIRAAMRAVERGEEPPVWPEPKAKSKETAILLVDEFADPPKRKRGRKPKAKADIPLSPTPMSPKTKVKRKKGDPSVADEKMYQAARAAATQRLVSERNMAHNGSRCIELGKFEVRTWYSAPYPEEYAILPKLYLCEFCLKYMKSLDILKRHQNKCEMNGHPPGKEIYRSGDLQVWEVDGKLAKIYCQNLCLLAKLFLDHKTLYYDVEPFWFYVLTLRDEHGAHFVGYFSKEKDSLLSYNVSCILTMPHMQRRGFGKFLIDFSYMLSRREATTGTPEKPLSALGKLSYESYWKFAIMDLLSLTLEANDISINDISHRTGMTHIDVINALKMTKLIQVYEDEHILVRDPELMEKHIAKRERFLENAPGYLQLDDAKLVWVPPAQRDTSW